MANIYVGVLILRLETTGVRSLKEKRSLITPLTEKIKTRFPVSVARLDGSENYHWEVIGVSAIAHDSLWLEALLHKVANFAAAGPCAILAESLQVDVWADSDDVR